MCRRSCCNDTRQKSTFHSVMAQYLLFPRGGKRGEGRWNGDMIARSVLSPAERRVAVVLQVPSRDPLQPSQHVQTVCHGRSTRSLHINGSLRISVIHDPVIAMRIHLLHQFQLHTALQTLDVTPFPEENLAKHATNQIANRFLLEYRDGFHRYCANKKKQELIQHQLCLV